MIRIICAVSILLFATCVNADTTGQDIRNLEEVFKTNSGDMSFCKDNYTYSDFVRDMNASSGEIKDALAKQGKSANLSDMKKTYDIIKSMCKGGSFPAQ